MPSTPNPELTPDGAEIPDPIPLAITFKGRKITKFDEVRSFIDNYLSSKAQEAGEESFEDANDFDVDDDIPLPDTPWEEWGDEIAEQMRAKAVQERELRKTWDEYSRSRRPSGLEDFEEEKPIPRSKKAGKPEPKPSPARRKSDQEEPPGDDI